MQGKLLLFLLPIIASVFVYSHFIYIDQSNECKIVIVPTLIPSNSNTKRVIKMIKEGSPEDYSDLCAHVSIINKNPGCGGLDGGCYYYDQPRTIFVGNDQGNIALAGAIIVHETCHAIQGQEGRQISESECYTAGNRYMNAVTLY